MFENPTWIDVINFLFCYIGAQTVIKGIVDFIYSNIEHKRELKRINEKYGGLDEETEKKFLKERRKEIMSLIGWICITIIVVVFINKFFN